MTDIPEGQAQVEYLRKSELRMLMVKQMCLCKEVRLKAKIQHTGTWTHKPTLRELEYIHIRYTKSPPTCFDTPWVPSSGSEHDRPPLPTHVIAQQYYSATFHSHKEKLGSPPENLVISNFTFFKKKNCLCEKFRKLNPVRWGGRGSVYSFLCSLAPPQVFVLSSGTVKSCRLR